MGPMADLDGCEKFTPPTGIFLFSCSLSVLYPYLLLCLDCVPQVSNLKGRDPCSRVSSPRGFEESFCVHLHGQAVKQDCLTMNMKAKRSFETSGGGGPTC